jgi:hypothetical protein
MMTETESPKKPIQIIIDKSQIERELNAKLQEANQQIGALEEANRALLAQDKEEFFEEMPKKPTPYVEGESTALLTNEPRYKEESKITTEGSYIEPSWVKGRTHEEIIEKVQHLAKVAENKEDFKKIESKLLKKAINGKGLNMEFYGDSRLFLKSPRHIPEFSSEAQREQIEMFNAKLRENRLKWRNLED